MHYAKTLKTAVAAAIIGTTALAAPALGGDMMPKHDEALARALAERAAQRLGDLRLGGEQVAQLEQKTRTFFGRRVEGPSRPAIDAIETGSIRSYQPHPVAPRAEAIEQPTQWILPRTDIRVVYAG